MLPHLQKLSDNARGYACCSCSSVGIVDHHWTFIWWQSQLAKQLVLSIDKVNIKSTANWQAFVARRDHFVASHENCVL